MVTVNFSSAMQSVTGGNREMEIDFEGTVDALFARLSSILGDEFRRRVCEDGNRVRRYINVYVDGKDIRFLEGQKTLLGKNSVVDIVPAVSGG
ncbi:MAG: MoaD/ThiS family protein [Thermoplasmata archaeon]|uniref:MoaD/ThiS family protein n=1 Tax=Candidatus Sysuiplasma superficiale TaxID=2823368 RepID=A0A8J7YRU8_9ARCH|nr:MoaD/ThiS family protein [Candidatus Sysuiplasma superficiale]MBX8643200.1 MoaD/ThiS family protein [Candidatus Sysuiplasma superficiale]MCL4346715.1 MoaD/ThiS family protein [Candidatus Thermoplasmatota archaeon]MCL5437356.1 MoaD/ThiS family protein [Candidatus Thermoplasmatota archaeon]